MRLPAGTALPWTATGVLGEGLDHQEHGGKKARVHEAAKGLCTSKQAW